MPLIGEQALQTYRGQRNLWIRGRYGSFKTAVSVRLAYEFLERGWVTDLICNFPCVIATDPKKLSDLRNVFIILDEGGAGRWLTESSFGDIVAFMRKRNLYMCVPSYSKPPLNAQQLNMQMIFGGQGSGMDFCVYTMLLNDGSVKERNRLVWRRPSEVFGMYNTQHIASDSGGILTFMNAVFRADGVGRNEETNPNDSSPESPFIWRDVKTTAAQISQDAGDGLVSGEGLQSVEDERRLLIEYADRAAGSASTDAPVSVSRRRKKTPR